MNHCENRSDLTLRGKENTVREVCEKSTSNSWKDLGVDTRRLLDLLELRCESRQEVGPQTGQLFLIPLESLPGLALSPGRDNQAVRHARWRMRLRTSSQGDPASGSASKSARRRFSSAFSSSGIETASGTAAMLSQRSSTRRMRSATGNSSRSATGMLFMILTLPSGAG